MKLTVEVRGVPGGEDFDVTGRNDAFRAPGLLGSSFTLVGAAILLCYYLLENNFVLIALKNKDIYSDKTSISQGKFSCNTPEL